MGAGVGDGIGKGVAVGTDVGEGKGIVGIGVGGTPWLEQPTEIKVIRPITCAIILNLECMKSVFDDLYLPAN